MLRIDVHDVDYGHPRFCKKTCIGCMLSQRVPVTVGSFNPALPDFSFLDHEGGMHGVSRKQVGEVLASIDALEEQLKNDYDTVDYLHLVIEGIILPQPNHQVLTLDRAGKYWVERGKKRTKSDDERGEPYHFDYYGYRSKLHSLRRWCVEVIEVPNREALALELEAMYTNYQKDLEEHATFRRAVKAKLQLPPGASPFVRSLMGLVDPDSGKTFVGEETAKALDAAGYTPYEIGHPNCGVEHLADVKLGSGRRIGKAMADKLRRALGV